MRARAAAPPPAGMRRRLLRNLAWVGSSQAVIAVLGLVSLALTARALGPAGLGVLAVVEAYSRSIARILHPEPWQAVIKHGADALEAGEDERFERLVWLSLMTDLALGALAAVAGMALAGLAARWMGAVGDQVALLALGSTAALLAARPTAMGVLRLYDRFDLLARIDMGIAVLRLALVAAVWAAGGGLFAFVLVFVAWTIVDGLLPMLFALPQMRRRGHRLRPASPRRIAAENPGLLRLFVNSNVNVTLRQLRQRFDIVLLAGVLPAPALGHYQLARRIGEAALRLGRPLGQVTFPEFARLVARGDRARLRRLMVWSSLGLSAALLLVLAPVAMQMDRLLPLAFGPGFAGAAASVSIMAAAMALYMAGLTSGPALMALGRDRAMTVLTGATTAFFFAALIPAARIWGAEGAAAMQFVGNALWLVACLAVALSASRPQPIRGQAAT